jgi:hypothetical protein
MFSLKLGAFSEIFHKPSYSPPYLTTTHSSSSSFILFCSPNTHTHGSILPPLNHENLHHFLTCLLPFSLLSSTLESWEPWHERALISCWKHCIKWSFKSKNRKSFIFFIFLSSLLLFMWICGCLGRVFELKTWIGLFGRPWFVEMVNS